MQMVLCSVSQMEIRCEFAGEDCQAKPEKSTGVGWDQWNETEPARNELQVLISKSQVLLQQWMILLLRLLSLGMKGLPAELNYYAEYTVSFQRPQPRGKRKQVEQ